MIKKLIKSLLNDRGLFYLEKRHFYKNLPDDIKKVITQLKKNDICIDCGANIGVATSIFSDQGCKVFSFEPEPSAYKVLKSTFHNKKNVKIFNSAIGKEDSKETLYRHKDQEQNPVKFSEASSLISSKPNLSKNGIQVDVINFSKYINSFEKVKILKIDIEGYEVEILPILIKNNSLKNVDNIFLELHDHKWSELKNKTQNMLELIKKNNLSEKFYFDWP